ncbi:MAG TPA: hypothetical protein VE687_15040 [Stellaceae bacterium]|nr:hypothetical protein [Stellaceae bacterium]
MSRRLLSLFIVVTLGMTPQGWGTEPEVTPIIRFGNCRAHLRCERAHL